MLTISDVYGSLYGSWGIGNELILDFKPSKGELFVHANHFVKQNGVVVYHINEVIILGSYHANCENYGHFFMDNLAPLMVVPSNIFDRILCHLF